jgi:NAD(P)-dependent dehydrogenase (short-subunit alcohol dehydrogenase family)
MSFPSPVATYHSDTYHAINPTNPQLSSKGKNIVITGGGSGIGPVIAESFAKSGASSISILGRTAKTLAETKDKLSKQYPETKLFYYVADIVDKSALVTAFNGIAKVVGQVDVLVANAGYLPEILPIVKSNPDEWFNGFEVNVKGNYNVFSAFIPHAAPNAVLINVSTGVTHLPFLAGYSAYHTSKLAAAKFFDYVHQEYPELFVLNVHPGVIKTSMDAKTVAAGVELPYDTSRLAFLIQP